MRQLLRWLNLLLVLLTMTAYVSPYVHPASFWPAVFPGLLYPFLLLGNILFIIFWVVKKDWYALFSVAVILLGFTHLRTFVGLHAPKDDLPGRTTLTAMTFNSYTFTEWVDGKRKQVSGDKFEAFLNENEVSLLCLQEFHPTPSLQKRYADAAAAVGMKFSFYEKGKNLAVFSKYPITQTETNFTSNAHGFVACDIKVGDKPIRVYCVHLNSNGITSLAEKVADEGNLQEKETWGNIRTIMAAYKNNARRRAELAEKLTRHHLGSPYPVIICGDFNDTPLSFAYHTISYELQDSFKEGGMGVGTTYSGKVPGLRIDYILADSSMVVLSCKRTKAGFSDHYPVVARLSVATN